VAVAVAGLIAGMRLIAFLLVRATVIVVSWISLGFPGGDENTCLLQTCFA
jgi:hypothetical protein